MELTAWALKAPPTYMVVDLQGGDVIRYYADMESVPGGITNDVYKLTKLLFFKVPAKHVEWYMGSPHGVWNAPRRLAWREKDGVREFGCETWSAAWSTRSAFWIGKQGDVHPDAMFSCRHPVTLGAGEEWTPPQNGLFYVRVWWRGK